MISLIRTIIGYSLLLIVIADEIPAVGNEGQREEGQEGGDSVDAEESVATPSLQQQLITYGIGVVFGLIVGLVLLFYLCRSRRSGNEAKLPSTENYEKLATDDIEKCMELSSRNSVGSSEVDSIEEKNWDDWEGDNETSGEFIQSSSYVSSSSAPSLQAHPESVSPVSFRSSSSTGSLGKSNSKSISVGSKKKSSPKLSRRKTSTPMDDDVFASIGISAAPTFKESKVSPPSTLNISMKAASGASPSSQKRVSDVMADEDAYGDGGIGWVDGDDDLDI